MEAENGPGLDPGAFPPTSPIAKRLRELTARNLCPDFDGTECAEVFTPEVRSDDDDESLRTHLDLLRNERTLFETEQEQEQEQQQELSQEQNIKQELKQGLTRELSQELTQERKQDISQDSSQDHSQDTQQDISQDHSQEHSQDNQQDTQ